MKKLNKIILSILIMIAVTVGSVYTLGVGATIFIIFANICVLYYFITKDDKIKVVT